jgi:hypothetical protein
MTIEQQQEKEAGRHANSAFCNSTTKLEYYIHDEQDALRSEIIGDLTGPGVASIDHAWRTADSILENRRVVVGLTAVAEADDDGRHLLLNWYRSGARIVARSTDSRALAEGILGTSVPMPAAMARFSDFFLRRWSAAATFAAAKNE